MAVRVNFKVVTKGHKPEGHRPNSFVKQLKQEIERYNFEVRIPEDKPHKKASFVRSAVVFCWSKGLTNQR